MKIIEYSSNNSGGDWWLSDDDWKNLEKAGWSVLWKKDDPLFNDWHPGETRCLGALATSAEKAFPTIDMAIAEWESITGQSAKEEGCPCCGQPHNFYERTAA